MSLQQLSSMYVAGMAVIFNFSLQQLKVTDVSVNTHM